MPLTVPTALPRLWQKRMPRILQGGCVRSPLWAPRGCPGPSHAAQISRRSACKGFVATLVDYGLTAIEVWHSKHSQADVRACTALARRFNLGMSWGRTITAQTGRTFFLAQGAAFCASVRTFWTNFCAVLP